jgi:hypothetical protein
LPAGERAAEAAPLAEQWAQLRRRRRGPRPLAEALALVLARLSHFDTRKRFFSPLAGSCMRFWASKGLWCRPGVLHRPRWM